jgi:adenosine deaminase
MDNIIKFIDKIPKVELHFHLEGAIPINAIYELIRKYDRNSSIKDISDIEQLYCYKDFPHFIKTWHWQSRYIRSYEDFNFIAEKIAENLVRQNIKYVEANITPADFANQHGLIREKIVEAIRNGLDKYKDRVEVNLIYDFNRDLGPEFALEQLKTVLDIRDLGVVGVGLGGQEHLFPSHLYQEVFLKAQENELHTTFHAGEYAGPESIWAALKICKVERIGHGTSAIKDEALLACLKENQTHIELCPVSNVRTRVVKSIKDHPIKKYYKMGLNISINSDDPTMFNTSLNNEYTTLINELDFSFYDIKRCIEMAINSSWCSIQKKEYLLNELNNYFNNSL